MGTGKKCTNPGRKRPVNCAVQRPRLAGNILTLHDTSTVLKRENLLGKKTEQVISPAPFLNIRLSVITVSVNWWSTIINQIDQIDHFSF